MPIAEGVRTYASFAAKLGAHTGDASNLEGVAIGHTRYASNLEGVAIGHTGYASNLEGVAIGHTGYASNLAMRRYAATRRDFEPPLAQNLRGALYTNGDFHLSSLNHGWNPATQATFDTGILSTSGLYFGY